MHAAKKMNKLKHMLQVLTALTIFAASLNVGLRVECRRSKTKEGASNDEHD